MLQDIVFLLWVDKNVIVLCKKEGWILFTVKDFVSINFLWVVY